MKRRDEKTGRDGRRVLPKLARERGEVDKRMLNLDPTFKWTFFNLFFPGFQLTYLPTYLLSQENGNKLGPASPQAFFFLGSLANSFFFQKMKIKTWKFCDFNLGTYFSAFLK
jgi:hypothetical protein